jgi:predicted anti-sigma-YlaC factor YlaD
MALDWGVVNVAHVFFRAVLHLAVSVIAPEITMSVMTIAANNAAGFDLFTDNWL